MVVPQRWRLVHGSLTVNSVMSASCDWFQRFCQTNRLPESYGRVAEQYFFPLAERLVQRCVSSAPLLVGINGCQGSGKSTLARLLVMALEQLNCSAVALSLDDFYLTYSQRQALAASTHPLLATRGVPGTHDVALMSATLEALLEADHRESRTIIVPSFNKAIDDRTETARWPTVQSPVDVVIWEGWCLGVPPQHSTELAAPVNQLEKLEDTCGRWRGFANQALLQYQPLFDRVDHWIMLKAPDFDCVYQWRLEQEEKLAAHSSDGEAIMSPQQVARFIQFYQRITEWGFLAVPPRTHTLFTLDADRGIQSVSSPRKEVRV